MSSKTIRFLHRKKIVDLSQYKQLGWQNSWKTTYFDVDKNIVDRKLAKSFGYTEENHPEYGKCRNAKHQLNEKQMTRNGSVNVVWCDECKIAWKYDCSG